MGRIWFFQEQMPRGMVPSIQKPPKKAMPKWLLATQQKAASQLTLLSSRLQCLGEWRTRDKYKIQYGQQAVLYSCQRTLTGTLHEKSNPPSTPKAATVWMERSECSEKALQVPETYTQTAFLNSYTISVPVVGWMFEVFFKCS